MTEVQDLAEVITAMVALYAAGLSTYNFLEKRKDRNPRLQLGYRPGFLDFGGGQLSDTTINLEISNIGSKPVKITSHSNIQVLLPNGKHLVPKEDWQSSEGVDFPCMLSPGDSLSIWRDIRAFAQSL